MDRKPQLILLGIGAAVVAVCSSFGSAESFPSLYATLNVPFFLLAMLLRFPAWAFPIILTLAYVFWSFPYAVTNIASKKSLYLAGVLGLLSVAYYAFSYQYAAAYQGTAFFTVVCIVGFSLLFSACALSVVAVKKKSRVISVIADALLFSWIGWLSFAYIGELP